LRGRGEERRGEKTPLPAARGPRGRSRRAEQVVLTAGLNPPTHHLAATGGLLWHPQARMDLVRAGIGLYGLSPDPSVATGAAVVIALIVVNAFSMVIGELIPKNATLSDPMRAAGPLGARTEA